MKFGGEVELWACTHDLCSRVVQLDDMDAAFANVKGRIGKPRPATPGEEPRRWAKGDMVQMLYLHLLMPLDPDKAPRCTGGPSKRGGYFEHSPSVMRRVTFRAIQT